MPDSSTTKPAPLPDWDFDSERIPFPDTNSPTFARDLSTYVRKILLASPSFPRIYTDVVLHYAPNSNAAKILRPHYSKILEKVNMALKQQEQHKSSRTCTHIKVSGVRCGSPSLRGEQFCYFHQRMHRGVRTPPQTRLHPIACLEDEESIQAALMEVINALMRNTIDLKRATLILRALHIAVKNAGRVRFAYHGNYGVHDIPEYNAAPADQSAERTEIDLPITAATPYQPEPSATRLSAEQRRAANIAADQRRYEAKMQAAVDRQSDIRTRLERAAKYHASTSHATPEPPQSPLPTTTVHQYGTKVSTPQPPAVAPEAESRKPEAAKKKPSMAVKESASVLAAKAAAPKERKNAAHGASRG